MTLKEASLARGCSEQHNSAPIGSTMKKGLKKERGSYHKVTISLQYLSEVPGPVAGCLLPHTIMATFLMATLPVMQVAGNFFVG